MKQIKSMNIPVFIPHYGCPNDCVFCNQRKISGKSEIDNLDDIKSFIESNIMSAADRRDIEIAFFGGSFTGLPLEVQRVYLEMAKDYVSRYHLKGIRMSTRPDYINEEIMDFLSSYPVTAIELGVQSLDKEVLDLSKRNHTKEDVYNAIRLIHESKIELGLQMMIGLPGDTPTKAEKTAIELIGFKPSSIRIYPTLVIKGTELEAMFRNGSYSPLRLETAVDLVALILPLFQKEKITILRVGLQSNDGLNSEELVTGPYHPAFKELVLDKLIYNEVINNIQIHQTKLLKSSGQQTEQQQTEQQQKEQQQTEQQQTEQQQSEQQQTDLIELVSGLRIYSRLIGHKKENQKRFSDLDIHIKLDKNLPDGLIQILGKESSTVFTTVF